MRRYQVVCVQMGPSAGENQALPAQRCAMVVEAEREVDAVQQVVRWLKDNGHAVTLNLSYRGLIADIPVRDLAMLGIPDEKIRDGVPSYGVMVDRASRVWQRHGMVPIAARGR